MQGSIAAGAGYLIEGVRMLKHRKLRLFVLVPLIVNIFIFGSLIGLTVNWVGATMESWMNALPDWLSWLDWLLWPLVILTLALVTGYLFTAVALLIASPFNGLLAEKAEEIISGEAVAGPENLLQAFMEVPRALSRELVKLAYHLPLLAVVFVLSLIPPFNAAAPLLWFLFGAWMMAVQYVDYPMDNHRVDFRDLKAALRERRLSSLGFGGLVAVASGIPLLNFFIVPAAVCGATVFWCAELKRLDSAPSGRP